MAALSTDLDSSVDHVVLLSTDREPVGSAPRAHVHTRDTPLHLAFSLYVFNESGEVLLTRRALTKTTWPGVWTNTCCGHPRPGEAMSAAVARRLDYELGMEITDLECVLPDFGYRATDASGLVENEFCPVFRAHVRIDPESSHPNDPPLANPDEVLDWKWWKWNDVIEAARLTPFVFSPWSVQQMAQLYRASG
ncbi:MAG TPA: isopentenyl-diphosphate Delta-isomerase [Propionibacteriaceae bacterium]|nr:isopentenyl-diphosphate Delta-isomerase [Propionibacteriaceae bacterium]